MKFCGASLFLSLPLRLPNMQPVSCFFAVACGLFSACSPAVVPGHAVRTRSGLLPSSTNYEPSKDKSDRLVWTLPPDLAVETNKFSGAPNCFAGPVDSIEKCYWNCWEDPCCTHISYTELSKYCYLKKSVPKVSDSQGTKTIPLCVLRNARTSNSGTVPPVRASSLGSCAGMCQESSTCSHYNYYTETHMCELKTGRPMTTTTPKGIVGLPCLHRGKASTAAVHRTIGSVNAPQECARRCRGDPQCTHFSYKHWQHECLLHSGAISLQDDANVSAGTRSCECRIPDPKY
ncbi:microneme protein mic4 [Cystoisospora suis]|uniref:Microneme protein mic4 n=1 Tax=Cystoisospora suis TaxID=483139 RepID=A0A2C6L9R7_9APIC|nr:microneme protein mic4 [Cystoisospora suis]